MVDENKLLGIKSDWQPITSKADLAILGKLIEELGECSSIAARCIIQGIDESDPETGVLNLASLRNEIADVVAMCSLITDIYSLDTNTMDKRTKIKYAHKMEWYMQLVKDEENV